MNEKVCAMIWNMVENHPEARTDGCGWERMMVVMIESSLLFGSIIFQRSREEVKPESVCRGVRLHPRVDTLGRGYYLVWIPPNLSNADGDVTIMECSFQE